MPNEDILNRANFGLLQEEQGRWRSFGVSAVINGTIVVLLLTFAAAKIHQAQVKRDMAVLIVPVEVPKPIKPPVPKVKIVAPPVQLMAKLDPPKIEAPKPEIEPPKPVKLDTPKPMPIIPPAPPKAVAPPPAPKMGLFASAKPTEVANNQQKPTIKSGGFGDPVGAKTNPNSTKSLIASVGAFNQAPGEASGAGAARKGVVTGAGFGSGVVGGVAGGTSHGTVASAGFSNGVIGGTPGGTGHGTVGSAGFGAATSGKPIQVAAKQEEPAFTPPVVISEPKAQYTSEAQQQHVEGEVTLQVRFLASGQVEVLRVVSGLGHGLDEQAKHVAENIRFKPAQKNGQPVDHVTLIHITFQLA
jgi:TonB family protein